MPNLSPNGISSFFERALAHTSIDQLARLEKLNLSLLHNYLEDEGKCSRLERFPEGSRVEGRLRKTTLIDEEHEDMPFRQVILIVDLESGIRIPYTTGYEALQKAEIVKRVAPQKSYLDPPHCYTHHLFANWVIGKHQLGYIFIFTNEMTSEREAPKKAQSIAP